MILLIIGMVIGLVFGYFYDRRPASEKVHDKGRSHRYVRKHLVWGTYGPKAAHALKWVPINTMSRDHMYNILGDYNMGRQPLTPIYINAFNNELRLRNEK